MPIYDYKCDACQHAFEENHPMSAPPVRQCPACGAEKVRKILSTGGIVGSTKGGQDFSPPAASPCGGGGCGSGMCGMPGMG
ncbi:MAG: zinc ribbon domain-containing protein [Magnetococcales bacterium]|nr:zinc ribbon domain-containing protein [Magnetococcales bacterium]MBF0156648.1 zinc ribbon domain-containing protein [Magnetococcales bacterium]